MRRHLAEALEGSAPPEVGAAASASSAAAAQSAGASSAATPTNSITQPHTTRPYTPSQILQTQQHFADHHKSTLLIYDPTRSAVEIYIPAGPDLEGSGKRYWPAFLVARSLYEHFPDRVGKEGSQMLALLYSTEEYPHLNCLGTDGGCAGLGGGDGEAGSLAPILSFGSIPRDPTVLPTATAMPFPSMVECLVRDCRLLNNNNNNKGDDAASTRQTPQWSDLKPQIVWRGDDYATFGDNFQLGLQHGVDLGIDPGTLAGGPEEVADRLLELWDTLTPSWRAVASSLRARIDAERAVQAAANAATSTAATEDRSTPQQSPPQPQPWIDAKFTMGHSPAYKLYDTKFSPFLDGGSPVATAEYMGTDELASYRYHLDLATGGGTSWEDTVRKLALPGLLFHHEILMKDWFYDDLKAWEHYVPVRMDLSDLSEKCTFARMEFMQCLKLMFR